MKAPEEHIGAKVPVVTTSTSFAALAGSLLPDYSDHFLGRNYDSLALAYLFVYLVISFLRSHGLRRILRL